MTSINYTSSFCELSNPPKCFGNSIAHYEALTMCFIKRTVLNLSTDSREEVSVVVVISSWRVQIILCKVISFKKNFSVN